MNWVRWFRFRWRQRGALNTLGSAWVYLYRVDPTYCSDPARKLLVDCVKQIQFEKSAAI